ncbi:unnamed protein product [Lampetra planeri]
MERLMSFIFIPPQFQDHDQREIQSEKQLQAPRVSVSGGDETLIVSCVGQLQQEEEEVLSSCPHELTFPWIVQICRTRLPELKFVWLGAAVVLRDGRAASNNGLTEGPAASL